MGEWKRFGQGIERTGAHRALGIVLLLLVALTGATVKATPPTITVYKYIVNENSRNIEKKRREKRLSLKTQGTVQCRS